MRAGDNCAGKTRRAGGVPPAPEFGLRVAFITLDCETRQTNVIVWPKLVEGQRHEVLQAGLLGVVGAQNEAGVIHVIARRLVDESALLGRLKTASRGFRQVRDGARTAAGTSRSSPRCTWRLPRFRPLAQPA